MSENEIALHLLEQGFCIDTDFLSSKEVAEVLSDFEKALAAGCFHRAGIGKNRVLKEEIRRDEVFWLEERSATATQRRLLQRVEDLRFELNGPPFYLGVQNFEGHYAKYSAGGFYHRHLDQMQGDDSRTVSFVLYLNQNWTASDGGQLRIYTPSAAIDVEPKAGTLACFMSADFEHEVLQSFSERLSFTGWLKK